MIQVTALSTAGVVWMASVVALEPQLGGVGAGPPIIPLSILVSESDIRAYEEAEGSPLNNSMLPYKFWASTWQQKTK